MGRSDLIALAAERLDRLGIEYLVTGSHRLRRTPFHQRC